MEAKFIWSAGVTNRSEKQAKRPQLRIIEKYENIPKDVFAPYILPSTVRGTLA